MYVCISWNVNWAQGRLMYIVPLCILYLLLFTGLSLTLIHVFVGEPREVQTHPQWSLYGTTKVLKRQPLRLTYETRLRPSTILCYFVMLARTLVYVCILLCFGWLWFEWSYLYRNLCYYSFCCVLLTYVCMKCYDVHISTALWTKF